MTAGTLDRPVALVSGATDIAGAEIYAAVLVEGLRGRCDFVAVLSADAPQETQARLQAAGADVIHVPGLRRRPSLSAVARLTRLLRDIDPALVHVNLSDQGDGLAPVAAAKLARTPLLGTLHLVLPGRAAWREAVSRRALRRFDLIVGVSHAVGQYIARQGARGIVVKNGLPRTPPAPNARAALGLDPNALVVGGVGRLHEQKGWDVLCRAASLVRRELPDAVFVVIGDGPQRAELASIADCRHVRFLGYQANAAALIPAFDILAVPSRFEGLGLTPLEALFQGVPVVATRIEGLAEVLGDCAVLVPPDSAEALASAIVRVASAPDLRADLVDRGRRRANSLFTAERMSAETFAIYERVAAGVVTDPATLMEMHAHQAHRVDGP